jgi:hypothetical protein
MGTGCRRYLLFQRGTKTAGAATCLRFISGKKSVRIAAFSRPGLPVDSIPRRSRAASRAFEEHSGGRCPRASRSGPRRALNITRGMPFSLRGAPNGAKHMMSSLASRLTSPETSGSQNLRRHRTTKSPAPHRVAVPLFIPARHLCSHSPHDTHTDTLELITLYDAMTSKLAQKAGLKLFEKHIQAYTPVDPLYETYTDERGKTKRRKVRLLSPACLTRTLTVDV